MCANHFIKFSSDNWPKAFSKADLAVPYPSAFPACSNANAMAREADMAANFKGERLFSDKSSAARLLFSSVLWELSDDSLASSAAAQQHAPVTAPVRHPVPTIFQQPAVLRGIWMLPLSQRI